MNKEKHIFQQDDHVILPKATLKRFVDKKTNLIAYLDLSNDQNICIKKSYPKSFHSELNYYDPTFDKIIKRYETLIGNLNQQIMQIQSKQLSNCFDVSKLKDEIIQLITLQFNRTVLADESLLGKYRNQEQLRYKNISSDLFKKGAISKDFIKNKKNFESCACDYKRFRYYAQNIIGQSNSAIQKTYANFMPYILLIPNEVSSTFLLAPQHFVATDTFARFVISPRIALALYPSAPGNEPSLIQQLTEEDVDMMFPRAIESALCIKNKTYRQVIGKEEYLIAIINKLNHYKNNLHTTEINNVLLISGGSEVLQSDQAIQEMMISIMLFTPQVNKIIIDESALCHELLELKDQNYIDNLLMFKKREYEVVILSSSWCYNDLVCPIQIVQTKAQALKMLAPNEH